MDNLTAELNVVGRRRAQLKADIQAETDRLLDDRANQLGDLESKCRDRLIPIEKSISETKDSLKKLQLDKLTLETDINTESASLIFIREASNTLDAKISDQELILDQLYAKQTGLENSLDDLTDRKNTLLEENSDLETLNSEHIQENRDLESQLEVATNDFNEKQATFNRDIDNWSATLRNLKDKSAEAEAEEKLVRRDLAARIRAVDEREKNVKLREYKLNRDQDMIERNAGLLEL